MVKDVLNLCAEGDVQVLLDGNSLDQRCIPVTRAGTRAAQYSVSLGFVANWNSFTAVKAFGLMYPLTRLYREPDVF